MNMNSIRYRIAGLVTLLVFSLFIILYFISSVMIQKGFYNIELDAASSNALRTRETIMSNVDTIKSKLSDWAQWDDAYRYVKDKNADFEKSNLQENIVSLKFNFFSFWNLKKEMVWGSNLNLNTEITSEKKYPMNVGDISSIQSDMELHSFKNYLDKRYAFIKLSEGEFLVGTVPIISTSGEGEVRGKIIAGIKLDDGFFNHLSSQLHLDITKIPATKNLITDKYDYGDIAKDGWALTLLGEKESKITMVIKDNKNEPLIAYSIKLLRDINIQAHETLKYFLFYMILSSIIIALLSAYLVDKLVLKKISILSNAISEISETGDMEKVAPDLGEDEIGQLSKNFNHMLYELNKLKAASMQNEKLASLGEMAGGIAHEINNPITIISASSNLLRKMIGRNMFEPEKLTKQLDDIDRTLTRISKIISGLKNVSRDTTHETISKHVLGDVLGDSLAVCSEKFKLHGVKINVDLESDAFKTEIDCYRVQLSQVFFNLLGNAFDAVEKSEFSWVSIQGKIVDKFLEIRFIDSGTGIPIEIQNKIFQPFYTTKPIGKGTGLGLSLCNSIIKRHNGEFFVDNNSSNTCFVIRLPLEVVV